MMKIIKHYIIPIVLIVLASNFAFCQNSKLSQFDFLIGTWKMEDKESYETWEKLDGKIKGQSYKADKGVKIVTENIEIKLEKNRIVYTPTVFDQNDGKGIPFELKLLHDNLYSFENLKHDFPKKIQYKILNENKLFISVLGENDKGFSYHLIRKSR